MLGSSLQLKNGMGLKICILCCSYSGDEFFRLLPRSGPYWEFWNIDHVDDTHRSLYSRAIEPGPRFVQGFNLLKCTCQLVAQTGVLHLFQQDIPLNIKFYISLR